MSDAHPGVYLPTERPDVYISTPLANAGWYDEGQHGGALSALIAGHVEKLPTLAPMQIARITVEIFRVVPLVPLHIETEIVREGKRIQTVQARVRDPEGTLVTTATVQRLRITQLDLPDTAVAPSLPFDPPDELKPFEGHAWGVGEAGKTMFHRHAIEVREVYGGFSSIGPGAIWVRLTKPIIAGHEPTATQKAVAIGDFCNGISRLVDASSWVFMNSDLTVHLARPPEGEWVALAAESRYGELGRGLAAGTLWDKSGWLGRSAQTLFLDRN